MDLDGEKMAISGEELLKAQSHVWNHILNFINSMALKCAVELEIPDTINLHGTKPMSLSKLVSALRLNSDKTNCVYRLMRILIHSGFFEEKEEGYVLTKSCHLLLKNNPFSVTPFLHPNFDPLLINPWLFLSVSFRNGDRKTPFEIAQGMPLWEYFGNNPGVSLAFNEAMASDSRLVTSVLLDKYRHVFYGIDSIVDVGGGTGTVGRAIAGAFPEMEFTVFDLPHVVSDLKRNDNLKYLGGDMFEEIPPADALLLKWILHDWNDEDCVKILKKCKEAIRRKGKKGGKVIVIDMVVENEKSVETKLFSDMLMMTLADGKERDEKEWAKLFYSAGFSDFKIFPILGLRSLIEIYP